MNEALGGDYVTAKDGNQGATYRQGKGHQTIQDS